MEHVVLEGYPIDKAPVVRAHNPDQCVGQICCLHRRTNHHMRVWKQHWRSDRQLMERLCPHGIGHPDPDHIHYAERTMSEEDAWAEGVHGCDGCCTNLSLEENE